MAEEDLELTPEEEAEIRNIFAPLEQNAPEKPFHPMNDQFEQEISELKIAYDQDETEDDEADEDDLEESETPPTESAVADDLEDDDLLDQDSGGEVAEDITDQFLSSLDENGTPSPDDIVPDDLTDLGYSGPPRRTPQASDEQPDAMENEGLPETDDLSMDTDFGDLPETEELTDDFLNEPDLGSDVSDGMEDPFAESLDTEGDDFGSDFDTPPDMDSPAGPDLDDLMGEEPEMDLSDASDDFPDLEDAISADSGSDMDFEFGGDETSLDTDLPAPDDTLEAPDEELDAFSMDADDTLSGDLEEAPGADEDLLGGEEDLLSGDDLGVVADDFGSDLSLGGMDDSTGDDLAEDALSDDFSGGLDESDLAEMASEAQLAAGIGEEMSDSDLATIRDQLLEYPVGVKKAVIESVVEEKVSREDQRRLMELVADRADPETIAGFLEMRLGYRPDTQMGDMRSDGVQIIYADGLSPEALAEKRRRSKIILLTALSGFLAILMGFAGMYLYNRLSIRGIYEAGLEDLHQARYASGEDRLHLKESAENRFSRALARDGKYSIEYLNRYGMAYMQAGFYEDSFVKLFGKIEPDYNWRDSERRAPLLRAAPDSRWRTPSEMARGKKLIITDRDNVPRTVIIPGAYIVSRIRDGDFNRTNLLNLGRFHSYRTPNALEELKYENPDLAIDYYRLILTLMNRPNDTEAMAGIARIYYDRKEFASAAREYSRIVDRAPMDPIGHSGLLNTYIEIWKKEKDPRFVIARHRLIRKLGLEKDIPMYVLTKLAGFYIDLDEDDLRISYQVDPVDHLSGLDIRDNIIHILELVFNKTEKRAGEVVHGSQYGEGFYRRGQFLMKQKESVRALRQYQNAHKYDERHYPAINAMGEYYMQQMNFPRAEEYFKEALDTYKKYRHTYGLRPEDETLLEGDVGKIYYNLGSLLYMRYAGGDENDKEGFSVNRIYPARASRIDDPESSKRRERLREASRLYRAALDENIKDSSDKIETIYRLGWIDYIHGDFEEAIRRWEELESVYDYNYVDTNLHMARGNSYYYTNQYRSALGSYLKVQSDLERQVQEIPNPDPEDPEERKLYLTMGALYNNIGAVYEKEYQSSRARGDSSGVLDEMQQNALLYYWKAVEQSRRVNVDSEIARTNVQLSFKERGDVPREPLLDDWVSPVLSMSEER